MTQSMLNKLKGLKMHIKMHITFLLNESQISKEKLCYQLAFPTLSFLLLVKNIVESSKVFGQKVYVVFKSSRKTGVFGLRKGHCFSTEVVTRNIDKEVWTLIVEDYQ